jgi:hypothetical protein
MTLETAGRADRIPPTAPPSPATTATERLEPLQVSVSTDAWEGRLFLGVLLAGVAIFAFTAVAALTAPTPSGDSAIVAMVGLAVVVVLIDVFGTEAQLRWLRPTDKAGVSIRGVSAALRPESAYLARDGRFELRSVLFRRRLTGFDRPNRLGWDSLVLVRLMPARRSGFRAKVTLNVWGPGAMVSGPRAIFGHAYLWLTDEELPRFVRIALAGRAHVHVDPKLLPDPDAEFRECTWGPAFDRSVVGTCLAGSGTRSPFGG